MKRDLSCIMLIDDNENDNFFHAREIKKYNPKIAIIEKTLATDALEYLKSLEANAYLLPDLILLDINMPYLNGWEFLEEYSKFDQTIPNRIIIMMLSTSGNPNDIEKSKTYENAADYITKPLTRQILDSIDKKFFKS